MNTPGQTSAKRDARQWSLAPIEGGDSLLRLCVVLVPPPGGSTARSFVVVNETLDAQGVLGCFADQFLAPARWVVIWLARSTRVDIPGADPALAPANPEVLRRWEAAWRAWDPRLGAQRAVGWPAETPSGGVLLVAADGSPPQPLTFGRERLPLRLCTDDTLLAANKLPTYSESNYRFLIAQPASGDPRFVWLSGGEGPVEESINVAEVASAFPERVLLNAGPGFLGAFPIRVTPFHPVRYSDLAATLHGEPLRSDLRLGPSAEPPHTELEASSSPLMARWTRGRSSRAVADAGRFFGSQDGLALRHLEANYLRIQAIGDILSEVRDAVDLTGLPLFNVSPESFVADIELPREGVPFLWQTRVRIARPGIAREARLAGDPSLRQFLRPSGDGLDSLAPTRSIPDYPADAAILDVSESGPDRIVLRGRLNPRLPIEVATTDLLQFYLQIGDRQVVVLARPLREMIGKQAFEFQSLPFELPAGRVVRAGAQSRVFVTTIPLEGTPHDLYAVFVLACRLLLAGANPLAVTATDAAEEAQAIAALESLMTSGRSSGEGSRIPLFTKAEDLDPKLYPAPLQATDGTPAVWPIGIPIGLWADVLRSLGQLRPGWPECGCRDFSHFETDAPGRVFDAPLVAFSELASRFRTSLLGERPIDADIRSAALAILAE